MTLVLVRLAIFITVGGALWALSRRFPMAEYGPQPVQPVDRWFFVASLALAGTYDGLIAPGVEHIAVLLQTQLGWLREQLLSAGVWVQVALFMVVTDFLGYWMHRFMHSRLAWRVHAFHHSPTSLNWLSGMRGSPLHWVLLLTPATLMASVFLLTPTPWVFVLLAVTDALIQNLMHTNLRLPYARQLERFIITPRMHFVHHHSEPRYGDSNYGFNFAIWDHLFGTYLDADKVEQRGHLGDRENHSVPRMFLGLPVDRA